MAKNKKTFDQLHVGCYFWSAGLGGIARYKVHHKTELGNGNICIGISWYTSKEIPVGVSCFDYGDYHWYVDKEDARKKTIELIELDIKKQEDRLVSEKQRLEHLKEIWDIK